ncbi:hypothetical protein J3492_00645 [Psychrobacter sp. F1192]|uniref:Putrescine-ornithine antiporter n=1 Tax=Psychrobacter coccoides TaxID=2818440 RepID=A0ABS3NJZ2_9GAMM|nr:hypothetical protein [Psychrobacter coccoides]MBO1529721.1 hypothetical protein [Psychrobacter coccoides]
MFNSDPSLKNKHPKLSKEIMIMVEKNNLVMAIKTLAADENISMDAAKERIDDYENSLKIKQQQKLTKIANKQGIPNEAISFDRKPELREDTGVLVKDKVKTTQSEQGFKSLQSGVESKLGDIGYKQPLIPYWFKRVLVIAIVMIGMFWILWRVFG